MGQIHKCFTDKQVILSTEEYIQEWISRSEVEGILEINKPRFFYTREGVQKIPKGFLGRISSI